MIRKLSSLLVALAASAALAEPQFVTLPGTPNGMSSDGTVVVGSNGGPFRWVRSGASATYTLLFSSTAGGSTYCSADGSVVISAMPNTNIDVGPLGFSVTGRWTGGPFVEQHDPTFFPGTGTPNTINFARNVTRDGRYIVGVGYINATTYRGMVFDSSTGTAVRLNPVLNTTNTGTRALCVSDDASVLGGDDGTTGSEQRPCIWRRNGSGVYVGQVLEVGVGGAGGATINCISADGSKASGRSYFDTAKLVRWEYNAGTNSYTKVILATALTGSSTTLTRVDSQAMTPDGDTIFGQYNGSRAFVWTSATGMRDLTNELVAEGITGMPAGNTISFVAACSSTGRTFVGGGGFGGSPFVIYRDGGVGCVGVASTPVSSTSSVSVCSRTVIINAGATGTGPFTYQHRKNGVPIFPGPTGNVDINGTASVYAIDSNFSPSQLRVNNAGPLDAGTYDVVITNGCGSTTTTPVVVTAEPQGPYDTCATALEASGAGSFSFGLCGAYQNESPASCATTQRADVWIHYTAINAGNYRITTCGQSNFDTILSAYDSCGGAEIAGGCNNNFCGSLASLETVPLAAGQQIYVRLAAGSSVPTSQISVSFEVPPPPPANDLCANATEITGAGTYNWDNTYALTDGAASCQVNSGKDVWFRFVSPTRSSVTFDTCGTTLNTVLAAFDSCGGSQLACNDNSNINPGCTFQSAINNLVINANTPVLIRIGANTLSGAGAGVLNVTVNAAPCPQDFNQDGDINPDDLGDFITCYFNEPPCAGADFNSDTNVDPDDLGDFITAYFGPGC